MTMLNLFALTSNPERRVLRLALSQEVQNDLTDYLKNQEQDFNKAAEEEIDFDGKYKPDESECLVISNFDDLDNLDQAVSNPLSVPEIRPDPDEFETIKALFTVYVDDADRNVVLLQNFDKRKIISTRGLSIFHSANVYKKVDGVGVTIDSKLSAIIVGSNLKFFSFHMTRQIFDLSAYYIEATDSDIQEFSEVPAVRVQNMSHLVSISDKWIRRKLALVKQSGILETVPVGVIRAAATEFSIELSVSNEGGYEAIVLPQNKAELKKVLRFLDEDYYRSPLSDRSFVSNSKRPT